jgi:phosphatidylserine decarboxylase
MNVFDVHVNRVPADGEVVGVAYRPGRFFNASFDKASEHNERLAVAIRIRQLHGGSACLTVVQIAGLIARRIKCNLALGDVVRRGERYGIIRFGSRLDVYLPPGLEPRVTEGQRVIAGETVLATWS